MNIPLGWLIALASGILGFVWLGGRWEQLWVPEEFLVIFGAAFGTLIAANKWRNLRNLFFCCWSYLCALGQLPRCQFGLALSDV